MLIKLQIAHNFYFLKNVFWMKDSYDSSINSSIIYSFVLRDIQLIPLRARKGRERLSRKERSEDEDICEELQEEEEEEEEEEEDCF